MRHKVHCENHAFREKLAAIKAFEATSSAEGPSRDDEAQASAEQSSLPMSSTLEAGPSTEGQKGDTEAPAPAKKKNKKKKKKKKKTTTEEAKDAAQTVEGNTCPEDQEDEEISQDQPPASPVTETLDMNMAETEVHQGSSSPQDLNEDSKSQTEKLEVTTSPNPAEPITSAEGQEGDDEQRPQVPASLSSRAVKKKAKKQQTRKQAPQMSYQKWEKANKLKHKQPIGDKPNNPVVASASSAGGQGDNIEPSIEDPVVEEVQFDKDQEEDSFLTRENSTSLVENLPATDQQERNMSQEIVDPEVSGAPELVGDQSETSQHQTECPIMADNLSAEGQRDDHHEPDEKGPVVTELPLPHRPSPPAAPQPEDTGKPPKKKKKPVVIVRTPVAHWNQPGGSGVAPWVALIPVGSGVYICSCVANTAFTPQQPAVGHFALDEGPYGPHQGWQPGVMAYHPGGLPFRPQASEFEPGLPFHQM